jgi:hypothetical protein
MDASPNYETTATASAYAVPASQSEFTACVDRCVAGLLAQPPAPAPAQTQLRHWLADERHALADGTPVDLALFDSAILSVEERLPAENASERIRLLGAARQLAETMYAVDAPASQG